uniref:Regulatory protein TetR n=1 Tax=Salinispora arenicola (strain CNS-205) TaxID=391037 RepID=A8LZF0_SALAI
MSRDDTRQTERSLRVDAARNRERILEAARHEVARSGADTSLEQVARRAGLGSATVRRRFPNRRLLLEAVQWDQVMTLCAEAADQARAADPHQALRSWLTSVTRYVTSSSAMAASLTPLGRTERGESCFAKVAAAGQPLVERAAAVGAVHPGATAADLITVVTGIVLVTRDEPDADSRARQLINLAWAGLMPARTGQRIPTGNQVEGSPGRH